MGRGAGTGIMLVSRCNRRIPVARVSDDHVYHGRPRKAHTSFRERESCNSIITSACRTTETFAQLESTAANAC